jgi:SAM-dependent methyltransferase
VDIQNPADYWENRLKKNYGLDGTGFIGLGISYNRWMYKIRRQVVIREVRFLGVDCSNASILDVGSGTGFYLEIWKDLGCKKLSGIDITSTAIENLRIKYPQYEFLRADIGDNLDKSYNLFTTKYDLISSIDVLFHIVEDEQYRRAFKNIYDLLRPGGFFIFSENFLHVDSIRSPYQTSRSLHEIEDILSETGFKILKRIPFFVLMNNPVDTNSQLLRNHWKLTTRCIRKGANLGYIIGAFLYPIESILIRLFKEGPSTELMICKKEEENSIKMDGNHSDAN